MSPTDEPGLCAARRALLLGAGIAGLVAVTGCGGGDDQAAPGGASSAGGSKTPGAAPTTEDPFAPFPSGDGVPPGALVDTKEVPVGGGVLIKEKLVVQPTAGTFKAYSAKCPHQGFLVEAPAPGAGVMVCSGHNSQFKTADGSLVRGPATRGLSAIAVKVEKGYVVER